MALPASRTPEAGRAGNRVKLSLLDLPLRPDQLVELIPRPLREQAERLRQTFPEDSL
ncbi:hypothetical protein [Nonomuraea sp. NPDC049784]|uniref:hypothetical protein n=1 Tax=Nonomuraea sp. NPDC049784 TaxID=3154361 RepID=UPI0033ECCCC9